MWQEVIEPLVGGEGLRISMRGLEYMNDDPSEVDVLYAQIEMADGSNKLQVTMKWNTVVIAHLLYLDVTGYL